MVVHFDFSFWFWEYVAIYCYLPHEGLHTFLERKQFKVGPFDRYKWSYDPYKWPKTHGYIPGVVILVLGIYRIYEPQNINTIVESMSQKPGSQADVMLKLKTPNTKSLVADFGSKRGVFSEKAGVHVGEVCFKLEKHGTYFGWL